MFQPSEGTYPHIVNPSLLFVSMVRRHSCDYFRCVPHMGHKTLHAAYGPCVEQCCAISSSYLLLFTYHTNHDPWSPMTKSSNLVMLKWYRRKRAGLKRRFCVMEAWLIGRAILSCAWVTELRSPWCRKWEWNYNKALSLPRGQRKHNQAFYLHIKHTT